MQVLFKEGGIESGIPYRRIAPGWRKWGYISSNLKLIIKSKTGQSRLGGENLSRSSSGPASYWGTRSIALKIKEKKQKKQ